jgi:hypothetical protein
MLMVVYIFNSKRNKQCSMFCGGNSFCITSGLCITQAMLFSRAVARRKGMRHEGLMPKEEGVEVITLGIRSLVVQERQCVSLIRKTRPML